MNIQIERCKYIHMISCLVNIQVEICKHGHRMMMFGEWKSGERQRCSYDILFGECTNREMQICS